MKLILVTGVPRSGVSMVAGVVSACGAWGGSVKHTRTFDGPGAYENEEITNTLMKPFMRGIRADTSGQRGFPDLAECNRLAPSVQESWRKLVERIIETQGHTDDPVFYCNPLSSLVWPLWLAAFPDAQWVIVQRSHRDLVDSCLRTGYMFAYKRARDWSRWVSDYQKRIDGLRKHTESVIDVWPQEFINGDLSEVKQMIGTLGLLWNADATQQFLSPIQWSEGTFEHVGGE